MNLKLNFRCQKKIIILKKLKKEKKCKKKHITKIECVNQTKFAYNKVIQSLQIESVHILNMKLQSETTAKFNKNKKLTQHNYHI